MSGRPVNTGFPEKVTRSLSPGADGHIPVDESDALVARLKDVVGGNVSAFARRCGVRESLLRKYLVGTQPGAFNLVRIADAASVSVDWLASGRLPRSRAEVLAALRQSAAPAPAESCREPDASASYGAPKINAEALAAILAGILDAMGPSADLRLAAQKAVELYLEVLGRGLITPDGPGQHADCA